MSACALIAGLGFVHAARADEVRIDPARAGVDLEINGRTIRIERIQDTGNRLTSSFARTSRPCPPFCIVPISAGPGIATVGELEVLDFLELQVEPGGGLLIDTRLPDEFDAGTLPGAINIPFTLLSPGDNPYLDQILLAMGAERGAEGGWTYEFARTLTLFCGGIWCGQSARAIRDLRSVGYPADKLFYYRGGMQAWVSVGLTVARPTATEAN